jgi:hypothetical protein
MALSKPWLGYAELSGLMVDPLMVRPLDTTDFGKMSTMVTGPTTHQSPLAYWPTGLGSENVHVMAKALTELAWVGTAGGKLPDDDDDDDDDELAPGPWPPLLELPELELPGDDGPGPSEPHVVHAGSAVAAGSADEQPRATEPSTSANQPSVLPFMGGRHLPQTARKKKSPVRRDA